MGICDSQPLQKTTNMKAATIASPSAQNISQKTGEKKNNPSEDQTGNKLTIDTWRDSDAQLPEPPRPYFSFTSFILQNKKPQVFEWLFIQDLGKGSMSQIYLVKNVDTELLCVAKVYNNAVLHRQTFGNEDPPIDCLNREIKIMSSITHPNVLSFHEMIDDNPTNSTILILPYAAYGNLENLVNENHITIDNILVCAYQIMDGLAFMHSKNIAHRDIRPENILSFNETYYCISSFSIATAMEDENEEHTDIRGNAAFLPPEQCKGAPFTLKKGDVWAFGVTFFWSIYKKMPFNIVDSKTKPLTAVLMNEIYEKNSLEFPADRQDVPIPVRKMIQQMLEKDPKKRPTFTELQNSVLFERAREIQRTEFTTTNESLIMGTNDIPSNHQTDVDTGINTKNAEQNNDNAENA